MLNFLNTSNETAMVEGRKIGSEKDTKQAVSDPIEGIRSTPHSYPIHNQTYPIQAAWIRSTHSRIRSKLLVFNPRIRSSTMGSNLSHNIWFSPLHGICFLRHMAAASHVGVRIGSMARERDERGKYVIPQPIPSKSSRYTRDLNCDEFLPILALPSTHIPLSEHHIHSYFFSRISSLLKTNTLKLTILKTF